MGNTGPPRAATSWWCSRCGAGLVPLPPGNSSSVRCALCHGVTRVERARCRGVGDALAPAASLPRTSVVRRDDVPAGYPVARGNKRAVLVGVRYAGTDYELRGTVNDVGRMRSLLCDRFGFPSVCILVLTEEEKSGDRCRVPDAAMRWLVEGCDSGDSLLFHLSGHGVPKLDTMGDR